MIMTYNLTVSIVLYKSKTAEVIKVVETLLMSPLHLTIFLVDNSPTQGLKEKLCVFPNVEYIYTGKNLGFGAGHNIAINRSKNLSEFHLILNSDVVFEANILNEIYTFMKEHPEVGLLAPKVYNADGTIQFSAKLLPSPANLIVRRFIPIKAIKERMDKRYEFKFFTFDSIIEAPFLMGCFLFINTKVLDEISGFDERFFMYTEDIDLTRRIQENYKTIYYPFVSICHAHGRGSYRNPKLLLYHIGAAFKYFNKWGWFFDKKRKVINARTLEQFKH